MNKIFFFLGLAVLHSCSNPEQIIQGKYFLVLQNDIGKTMNDYDDEVFSFEPKGVLKIYSITGKRNVYKSEKDSASYSISSDQLTITRYVMKGDWGKGELKFISPFAQMSERIVLSSFKVDANFPEIDNDPDRKELEGMLKANSQVMVGYLVPVADDQFSIAEEPDKHIDLENIVGSWQSKDGAISFQIQKVGAEYQVAGLRGMPTYNKEGYSKTIIRHDSGGEMIFLIDFSSTGREMGGHGISYFPTSDELHIGDEPNEEFVKLK